MSIKIRRFIYQCHFNHMDAFHLCAWVQPPGEHSKSCIHWTFDTLFISIHQGNGCSSVLQRPLRNKLQAKCYINCTSWYLYRSNTVGKYFLVDRSSRINIFYSLDIFRHLSGVLFTLISVEKYQVSKIFLLYWICLLENISHSFNERSW